MVVAAPGAAPELPYMTEGDLDNFIAVNPELDLCQEEVDYLHLRRRRLSLQLRGGLPHCDAVRVVVCGEDSVAAALQCTQLFLLSGEASCMSEAECLSLADGAPCAVGSRRLHSAAEGLPPAPPGGHSVEVFAPPGDDPNRFLRSVLLGAADAVVLCFAIADPQSYRALRDRWIPEVAAACASSPLPPPIVVVGTGAELRRRQPQPGGLVSSEEAVAMAQDLGVAKYMEVFSGSVAHAAEIFAQALEAHGDQLLRAPAAAIAERRAQQQVDAVAFREQLQSPQPDVRWDFFERALAPSEDPAFVTYTTDGSEPTLASAALDGPLRLHRPHPAVVRLRRWERCRFPSPTLTLSVPPETPEPAGYCDVARRAVRVAPPPPPAQPTRYHYTTDGSAPSAASPCLAADPDGGATYFLDSAPPLHPLSAPGGPAALPEALRVVAVAEGCFRSRTARLALPPVLEQPLLHCADDGVLKVLSPQPHAEYRFTVDGSAPTAHSQLLTAAVMLPRGPSPLRVRVAAFPRLALPSAEAELLLPAAPAGASWARGASPPAAAPPVQMTKAASARIAHASQQRQHRAGTLPARPDCSLEHAARSPRRSPRSAVQRQAPPPRSAPAPPAVPNRHPAGTASGPGTPQRSPRGGSGRARLSPPRPASAPLPRTPTQHRQGPGTPRRGAPDALANGARPSPARHAALTPAGPPAQGGDPLGDAAGSEGGAGTRCSTHASSVDFDFDQPIAISHVTVTTPGGGRGPSGYRIEVRGLGQDHFTEVGVGALRDEEALQVLDVAPACRGLGAVKVRCHFTTPHAGPFQITDMKIHGKPL